MAPASKAKGLTLKDIVEHSKLNSGGTLTTILQNLKESGLISSCVDLNSKKKKTIYRLSEYYTAFLLRFILKKNIRKKKLGYIPQTIPPPEPGKV